MKVIDAYGYPAVGKCIYCGTTKPRLTKEHIVGRGIGGTVTLGAASCAPPQGVKSKLRPKTCSEITRDIEQFCFRNMLGHFRHHIGFPSSQRLRQLPLTTVTSAGRLIEVRDVAVEDHPALFAVPVFGPPGILSGTLGTDLCDSWGYVCNPNAVRNTPAGTSVGVTEFNAMTYARMLAKIAHAFAVADAGLHAFDPLLPDFILGKSSTHVALLVGCLERDKPAEPDVLHRVRLEDAILGNGRRYLVANIRLFAKFGAPQYHVVVGTPKANPSACVS